MNYNLFLSHSRYAWNIYIGPKRTYSCIQRMRGQQVLSRERIPNTMFVTLSTYFYVGARMLYCSRNDVVYTNTDDADCTDSHGFEVSTSDISFLSFEKTALLKSGFLPKLNKSPTCFIYKTMKPALFNSISFLVEHE